MYYTSRRVPGLVFLHHNIFCYISWTWWCNITSCL